MPPQFPPTPADRNGGRPPMPPQVPPGNELIQPTPLMFTMWPVPNSGPTGETAIVMRVATPLGGLHFILSCDEAIQIGGQLRQLGKASKTGLTLPPGVQLGEGADDDDVEVKQQPGPTITEETGSVIHLPASVHQAPDEDQWGDDRAPDAAPVLADPPSIALEPTPVYCSTCNDSDEDILLTEAQFGGVPEHRGPCPDCGGPEVRARRLITKDPHTHPQDCVGPGGLPCRQDGEHDYRGRPSD